MDKDHIQAVSKKMDILLVISLAKAGLKRSEIAKVLDISEKTIERMLPFGKLKFRGE